MEGIEKKKKLALYWDNEAYHFFFQYSAFLLSVLHHFLEYGSSPMRQAYLANSADEAG